MKKKENLFYPIFRDLILMISQVIVYLIFRLFIPIFFSIDKKTSKEIEKIGKGTLFISNHQSFIDPFVVIAHLPFRTFLRVIPVRFPMDPGMYKKYKITKILGTYSIGNNSKEKMLGLFKTRKYLEQGKAVTIFPEGKICRSSSMLDFKKGVLFLTDKARNIVFVKLDGFQKTKVKKKYLGKKGRLIYRSADRNNFRIEDMDLIKETLEKM